MSGNQAKALLRAQAQRSTTRNGERQQDRRDPPEDSQASRVHQLSPKDPSQPKAPKEQMQNQVRCRSEVTPGFRTIDKKHDPPRSMRHHPRHPKRRSPEEWNHQKVGSDGEPQPRLERSEKATGEGLGCNHTLLFTV